MMRSTLLPTLSIVMSVAASCIGMTARAASADTVDAEIAELEFQKQQIQNKIDALKKKNEIAEADKIADADLPEYTAAARDAGCAVDDVPCIFRANDLEYQQRLYVRANKLDSFYYLYPQYDGFSAAKGASVSVNGDPEDETLAVTLNGMVSYVFRHEFEADRNEPDDALSIPIMAIAPFVYANGKLQDPQAPSEKSALQVGLDAQLELYGGGLFTTQNFGFSPYWQTDLRGEGSIGGLQFLWEPYKPSIYLGARHNVGSAKLVGFHWRAVGEADLKFVDEAGLSIYSDNTNYAFLGGTVSAHAVLFENMPEVGTALCGRIHLDASYSYFWEADAGKAYDDFEAGVSYDLGADSPHSFACKEKPNPNVAPTTKGVTSISLTYNTGTDKDTLEDRSQYALALRYKF